MLERREGGKDEDEREKRGIKEGIRAIPLIEKNRGKGGERIKEREPRSEKEPLSFAAEMTLCIVALLAQSNRD